MTNSVTAVYLITSAFGAHILYRYMNIFFDCTETDKKIEIASYLMYYFTICLLFLAFNNPMLNVIANLIMFFFITYNYEATMRKRLIATISIYMIHMTIESTIVLTMRYFDITIVSRDSNLALITGLITIKIITYNVMLFLSNFKLVKNDIKVSYIQWLSIFVMPVGTLILSLILILKVNSENLIGILISIIIMFVINVFVFYLYDVLMKSYDEKMEKVLLLQQNMAYSKQLEVIAQSQENLKTFRHDVKNHVLLLKSLIEENDKQGASEYLESFIECIDNSIEFSKSGNSEIDSILNYKLNKAVSFGIKTNIKVNVPDKLNIRPFDLSVVLGNLLDNAIEAARYCEEKLIKISAELDRNVLYINVSNSFDGNLKYEGRKLITTKEDKENHGIGLGSVQQSLEKYNGAMEIHHRDKMFYVDVLIYNQSYEVKAF
ncbi:MAG: hypothetical protein K0R07_1479 [Sedimentibacter sp.]|jgi:sensor histidine kinase YesM|nr:hypothetical protein [Sedimentibacter sp.]